MLLALCSTLADTENRSELEEVLGVDAEEAARFAAELLAEPHPLLAAGAGLWMRPLGSMPAVEKWMAELPAVVTAGDIPTQDALDAWAAERTQGLIEHFPVAVTPDLVFLLATALATRISWEQPFEVVAASELAPSPWASDLQQILRSPRHDSRHRQYITDTDRAGTVCVHLTGARGGMLVGSVIATDESVPSADVLAAAEVIVTAEAREPRSVANRSLFDIPLGEGARWTISEESVDTQSPDGREELIVSVLPAWSAATTVDLDHKNLGYPAAAHAVRKALGDPTLKYEARQSAVARYGAVGFEAAAITHLAIRISKPRTRPGYRREATLRFGHPFAVVAATFDDHRSDHRENPDRWDGLPVFSAWITEAIEAQDPATP